MKNTHFEDNLFYRMLPTAQKQRIHRVIREELTQTQREVLIAYYFQDMTMAQIARERGVEVSTVCRTLHRAEERLKKFLKY